MQKGKGWLLQWTQRTRSTHAQPALPTGQGAWEKSPEQEPPVLNSPDCANHGTHIFTSLCFILNTLPSLQLTETPSSLNTEEEEAHLKKIK